MQQLAMRRALPRAASGLLGGPRRSCRAPLAALGRRAFSGDGAEPFGGKVDPFGSVSFDADASESLDSFRAKLQSALATWRSAGRSGVWAKVPNASAGLIPALLEAGFDWHHAKSGAGYAMLTLWLPDEPNRLPSYAGTQVGVGGLVLSPDNKQVLLMKEKVPHFGRTESQWKLPGGLADTGEDLGVAAAREVFEETGVTAIPEGVLGIHHRHGFRFGVSDIYFTVQMRAQNSELKADPKEVMDLTWMPVSEVASNETVMGFNKNIIALYGNPLLVPHWGKHGSIRGEHYFYKAAVPGSEE